MVPKEIIILAGGKGSRLKSVIGHLPKSMALVNGRPFIDYVILYYLAQGFQQFIISLGQGQEQLSAHIQLAWKHIHVQFAIEAAPLDTGGAIRNAVDHASGDTVLVINGDSYFALDIEALSIFHHMCGAECTIAVKQVPDTSRYGRIEIRKDYGIASFQEKGIQGEGLINGGAYLINTRMFKAYDFPTRFSFEKDYLQQYFHSKRIFTVKDNGYFIDIGIPEDLARAQHDLKNYDNGLDA